MNEQQFKIWFTGFYEGEGCIINDKSNNNRMRTHVSQNDPTPFERAMNLWGGNIYKRTRKSPASNKICVCYEWRLSHMDTLKFIEDIRPFMIIPYKIKQLEETIKRSEEGNNIRYKCNFCDKDYSSPGGRRSHELKYHISKGDRYKCDICNVNFECRNTLMKHHRKDHNNNTGASPEKFKTLGKTAQLRETPIES